jgi:hypothetical protein
MRSKMVRRSASSGAEDLQAPTGGHGGVGGVAPGTLAPAQQTSPAAHRRRLRGSRSPLGAARARDALSSSALTASPSGMCWHPP